MRATAALVTALGVLLPACGDHELPRRGSQVRLVATHDLGFSAEQAEPGISHTFKWRFPGHESTYASRIVTNCGCVAGRINDRSLRPGEVRELTVAVDRRSISGRYEASAVVWDELGGGWEFRLRMAFPSTVRIVPEFLEFPLSRGRLKRAFEVVGPQGVKAEIRSSPTWLRVLAEPPVPRSGNASALPFVVEAMDVSHGDEARGEIVVAVHGELVVPHELSVRVAVTNEPEVAWKPRVVALVGSPPSGSARLTIKPGSTDRPPDVVVDSAGHLAGLVVESRQASPTEVDIVLRLPRDAESYVGVVGVRAWGRSVRLPLTYIRDGGSSDER